MSNRNLVLQDAVYRFILGFMTEHDGLAPTLREIGKAVGITSTSHVHLYIRLLANCGRITLLTTPGGSLVARGIRIPGARWLPPRDTTGASESISDNSVSLFDDPVRNAHGVNHE